MLSHLTGFSAALEAIFPMDQKRSRLALYAHTQFYQQLFINGFNRQFLKGTILLLQKAASLLKRPFRYNKMCLTVRQVSPVFNIEAIRSRRSVLFPAYNAFLHIHPRNCPPRCKSARPPRALQCRRDRPVRRSPNRKR